MFEEDFERCFICQQPCRGLYCSAECRLQDKGTVSPAVKAKPTPVRLTAQLPIALSPHVRPTHHIAPSPVMPAHIPHADSSSSSSITSSPLQSPRTNPSASDSPQKDVFNLPPPAYPPQSIGFPGSVPVKIPGLIPRPSPQQAPVQGSLQPTGASIDTLRFGRRPGLTNSVTSPNALAPRCACGKPLNHKNRASSRERDLESGFSALALGPPRVKPLDDKSNRLNENRVVSDSAIPPFHTRRPSSSHLKSASGHGTPPLAIETRYQTISSVIGGGSLLSRSRSDPIPPSPKNRTILAPQMAPTKAIVSPSSRRASSGQTNDRAHIRFEMTSPSGAASSFVSSTMLPPRPPPIDASDRRGRSRERHDDSGFSGLDDRSRSGSKRRTDGPSRSRHRREERERDRRKEQPIDRQLIQEHAPITPSWSRRPSGTANNGFGGSVAPTGRRGVDGEISPTGSGKGIDENEKERRAEEVRKAGQTLGQMFGVAAG